VAWGLPSTPLGDELYYTETGLRMARGEGHVFGRHAMKARWPPGQSWWLSRFADAEVLTTRPALLRELSGVTPAGMDAGQRAFLRGLTLSSVLLGTLLVALCAALAGLLFDGRSALLSAALACAYPTFVAGSGYLWSETLFSVLLTAALVGVVAWWRNPRVWVALSAGACFGLAGLTREIGVLVAGAAVAWWIASAPPGRRSRAAAHGALLLAAAVVVILPWSLRNQRELGRLVPVSTVGWMGLREGNTLAPDGLQRDWDAIREFRLRYVAIPDELERMDMARGEAAQLIRDAQPGWLPRKLVINLGQLFGPGSDLLTKVFRGAYGELGAGTRWALLLATAGAWTLVLVAGVFGAATAPGRARRMLPLFLFAPLLLVHVVANAFPKYRVPLVPVLIAYASHALLARPEPSRAGAAGRVLVVAAIALLLASWVPFASEARRLVAGATTPLAAREGEPGARSAGTTDSGVGPASDLGAIEPGERRPGRIILLSMDTVRADAVASAELAPNLAAIADQGVRFEAFYAASNYTMPSHMTIFTGLDPAEHGVTLAHARLSPSVPTLAELLGEAGYRARGFHEGGYVESRFGFARGFELYRRYPRVELVREALPAVLEWMGDRGTEPYFLFLHTYAAHFPYGGFERYRQEHPDRGLPTEATLKQWWRRWPGRGPLGEAAASEIPPEIRYECTLFNHLAESHAELLPCGAYLFAEDAASSPHWESDLEALRRSYAERVRLVDSAVGRIRRFLEEREQWADTLLVVTSDHGEAFFEHGLARHDFVPFDEVIRVPLVVSWPAALANRGGTRLVSLAWHLDLFPTLLRLAGVEPPSSGGGVDLSPAILGVEALEPARSVFPFVLHTAHRKQEPGRRVALRRGLKRIDGHGYFGDQAGLLFDLGSDPGEARNLRSERPTEWEELQGLTAEWEQGLRPISPVHQNTGRPLRGAADEEALSLPAAQQEELRALGYAE
jgi:arylsulfatase A-like enzyme/4-amino-4-deoxy-L-arabinose transferase-like glycosyltransferase